MADTQAQRRTAESLITEIIEAVFFCSTRTLAAKKAVPIVAAYARSVRQEAYEECARAVCPGCAAGLEYKDGYHNAPQGLACADEMERQREDSSHV